MLLLFLSLWPVCWGIQVTPLQQVPKYHSYEEMQQLLKELAGNYSDFVTLYSIGESVEGRDLWVLKITAPNSPLLGAPNIKYVGNIHGNEPVGRELILYFAKYLLHNYHTDSEVKWILDRIIIHLLPSMNPDGFEKSREGDCYTGPGRENGNYVDLNRSFPDKFLTNRVPVQYETLAVDQWMRRVPFVLSASFHGGALVANYPYDTNKLNEKNLTSPQPSYTPDDDVFKHLAETYSSNHLTMHKGRTCNENQPSFPGGITNGAAWYSFVGGMQDFNYVTHGCMELTLEVSCCKYPLAQHLPRLWTENKRAMLELSKQAQMGVRGLIVDKITSAFVPYASLYISNRGIPFKSSKNGEFWRILLPGKYILHVQAKGYENQSFPFTVHQTNESYPAPTWLNIYLQPSDHMLASASSNIEQVTQNSATFHASAAYWILLLNFFMCFRIF